jgi:hypothetical protein
LRGAAWFLLYAHKSSIFSGRLSQAALTRAERHRAFHSWIFIADYAPPPN